MARRPKLADLEYIVLAILVGAAFLATLWSTVRSLLGWI